MRQLIADLSKIIYKISGHIIISLILSIIYVTLLNFLTIYGLVILLEDWLPQLSYLHKPFAFPYYIGTALILFSFNYWLMLPLENLRKEIDLKSAEIMPLIVYSVVSSLIFAYILLINRMI